MIIKRLENVMNQQKDLVLDLIEEIEEGEMTISEAEEVLEESLMIYKMIREILGESEREQAITNKIIRIKMAVKFIKNNEIRQAKYSLRSC